MTGAVPEPLPDWLTDARRIVVLTGAGISTESGIPDYRGPDGVWTKDPDAEKLVTLSYYVADPDIRRRAWLMRRDLRGDIAPNDGHRALAELERRGRLRAVLTQNIDGLHQQAGNSPGVVLELHGTIHEVACLSCGDRTTMDSAMARIDAGEPDPDCRHCGGILKSATISFGQMLDPDVLTAAAEAAADCDVFLAIGTSLTVHPAAGLTDIAAASGARVVVVNAEPTPYDESADLVVRERIGAALPWLLAPA
ncbi:SIR2 family NAD-dependent protein deacylase [Blastococcus tunisiensis]|uniref:protein acetyllysine N-acetyltransferase n=1 Tax=Blastococcus tunisiensis TaxID=1798228 RepID=A0A1I2ME78_9ACTN|nr:Sir2 family NAD-dependent protein deacetylase [Blastococcus sp. DSM 46838]SFF89238.1 NAD-dependent deacetylase [Blastococcus sp. DSM 46838]